MSLDTLLSPLTFLQRMGIALPDGDALKEYESWWQTTGQAISDAVDRAGTPHLRMFDALGQRLDEVLYPPDYWTMLHRGYAEGAVWRALEAGSVIPAYGVNYLTSFFDVGLVCPYTVSLSTALPLAKYGSQEVKDRFLPPMLRRDATVWQGATWMTEVRGGSDLGAGVETVAHLLPLSGTERGPGGEVPDQQGICVGPLTMRRSARCVGRITMLESR
jgi:alkylation response protein AidB-like acyl-CoA dehydrogenase